MSKLELTKEQRKEYNRLKTQRSRAKHPKVYKKFKCSVCNLYNEISIAGYAENCAAHNGNYICKSCACVQSGKTLKPTLHVKHNENGEKKCIECGQFKVLDNFTKWAGCSDGHRSTCKECRKLVRTDQ
jgi:hypothetical protein